MPLIRSCPHCGTKNRIPAAHLADTGRCGNCKQPLGALNEPIAADVTLEYQVLDGGGLVPANLTSTVPEPAGLALLGLGAA